MKMKEIEITVPWGHLAGKFWGDDKNIPVLLIHALMDNAATFDRLIPYLPPTYYYICIELPGHEKSTHIAPFFPYFAINFILVYQLIMNHFGRKSYTIIGHSYGSQISVLFTLLYPERVEKLILLDTVHLYPIPAGNYLDILRDRLDHTLKLYQLSSEKLEPTYTYDEALERFLEKRISYTGTPITIEAAEVLLTRSLTKVGQNKYKFSMNQRLKSFINPTHGFEYAVEVLKKDPIKCPLLVVFASETEMERQVYKQILDLYKTNEDCQMEFVDGGHDVHNDSPQVVGPIVSKFLLT